MKTTISAKRMGHFLFFLIIKLSFLVISILIKELLSGLCFLLLLQEMFKEKLGITDFERVLLVEALYQRA